MLTKERKYALAIGETIIASYGIGLAVRKYIKGHNGKKTNALVVIGGALLACFIGKAAVKCAFKNSGYEYYEENVDKTKSKNK